MEPRDRLDRRPPETLPHPEQMVSAPLRHEGVGLALRCAYLPRGSDLPRDFGDLLDKLG